MAGLRIWFTFMPTSAQSQRSALDQFTAGLRVKDFFVKSETTCLDAGKRLISKCVVILCLMLFFHIIVDVYLSNNYYYRFNTQSARGDIVFISW